MSPLNVPVASDDPWCVLRDSANALTVGQEYSDRIEVRTGDLILVRFTANSKYLISGGERGVRVASERVATMKVENVKCVAVSNWMSDSSLRVHRVGLGRDQVFVGEVSSNIFNADVFAVVLPRSEVVFLVDFV